MPFSAASKPPRFAVVDVGSNSVRLVVFEGATRNPLPIFNEKAVLRLGHGLESTGRLAESAMAETLKILRRYHAIARAMGVVVMEVLATSAVREASNSADFVAEMKNTLPGIAVRVLSGTEEAALSAAGVLCGIPTADGVLADIGGGSLELVRLYAGRAGATATLPLGVIRLSERANGDPGRARGLAEADLAKVAWLGEGTGKDLYLVGGAWRALARIHITQTGYPLAIVHHYAIRREEARDLAGVIAGAGRRALERLPGVSRRRIDDLPFAAVVLRRLLRAAQPRRVVFSANGLREGWYWQRLSPEIQAEDPLLAAAQEFAEALGRDSNLPETLSDWTDPLFPEEDALSRKLRKAACWMSDIGAREHPEYRAEHAFFRVLRQPGVGLDHPTRAFLALAVALRYEAQPDAPFLSPARRLLDVASTNRAEVLGFALRLAYTLSAGTPDLLAGTRLAVNGRQLLLRLDESGGVFAGEAVLRRLDRLAQALGLEPAVKAF